VTEIEVSELKMENDGWLVKGAYNQKIDSEWDWAYNFMIRINKDGKIIEYNSNA